MNVIREKSRSLILFVFFTVIFGGMQLCFAGNSSTKKPLFITSLPRSGGTFFVKMITESNNGKLILAPWHVKKKYKNTFTMTSEIFGGKYFDLAYASKNKIFENISDEELSRVLSEWDKTGFKATKESYLFKHFPFFLDKFTTVAFYRHRRYTFPSSSPHLIGRLYEPFITCKHQDPYLEEIKKFILKTTKTDIEKQCAMHMVSSYIMLKNAEKCQLPVVRWQELIRKSGKDLFTYLDTALPDGVVEDIPRLCHLVEQKRTGGLRCFMKKGIKPTLKYVWRKYVHGFNPVLAEREEKYNSLNVEDYNKNLLNHIKKVDSQFYYWYYLT
jgi:hypothetical protein